MQNFHQGSIIWLSFDPQTGHEESKRRPALIISGNSALSLIKGIAMVCPITSHSREFPTHVLLDERTKTQGFILCEQAKSLDLNAWNAEFIEKAPDDIVQEAVNIVHSLLD